LQVPHPLILASIRFCRALCANAACRSPSLRHLTENAQTGKLAPAKPLPSHGPQSGSNTELTANGVGRYRPFLGQT
jgi:hypothetical protein